MPDGINWLALTGETVNLEALRQEVIDLWENATSRLWDHRVGHIQNFWPENFGTSVIYLELWPIIVLTTVEEWDGEVYVPLVIEEDFTTYGDHGLLRLESRFWPSRVRVTYEAGYMNDLLPEDIRRALLVQAKFMIDRQADEKLITSSQSTASGSTSYMRPDLHPYFLETAKRHRRKA